MVESLIRIADAVSFAQVRVFSPGGTADNSPPIYRWVHGDEGTPVPQGRQKRMSTQDLMQLLEAL
jgi:hypothetical protein